MIAGSSFLTIGTMSPVRPSQPLPTVNCGVRVAEGAHRAYVTDFIRDARAGGCAQGVPPANLGFRLVREERSWVASVSTRWSKVWAATGT